jgi:hypothetical protein
MWQQTLVQLSADKFHENPSMDFRIETEKELEKLTDVLPHLGHAAGGAVG